MPPGGVAAYPDPMRRFTVDRLDDVSGVSGTGHVAQGVEFDDKHAVIHWLHPGTPYPTTTAHPDGMAAIRYLHGHNGRTRIFWLDDEQGNPHPAPVADAAG